MTGRGPVRRERPQGTRRQLIRAGLAAVAMVAVVVLATFVLLIVLYDPSWLAPDVAAAMPR